MIDKFLVLFVVVSMFLLMSIGSDLAMQGKERKRIIGLADLFIYVLWLLFLIWVIR